MATQKVRKQSLQTEMTASKVITSAEDLEPKSSVPKLVKSGFPNVYVLFYKIGVKERWLVKVDQMLLFQTKNRGNKKEQDEHVQDRHDLLYGVEGGVTFGPQPRTRTITISKNLKRNVSKSHFVELFRY